MALCVRDRTSPAGIERRRHLSSTATTTIMDSTSSTLDVGNVVQSLTRICDSFSALTGGGTVSRR